MANRRISRAVEWGVGVAACASLAVGAGGVSAAATATTPALVPTAAVRIVDFRYKPRLLTIVAGTKVTWTNYDGTGHNVVFKRFGSIVLGTGETYSHAFKVAGTFRYHCTLHFDMKGKVVVTAAS
jgi:plastocyanin